MTATTNGHVNGYVDRQGDGPWSAPLEERDDQDGATYGDGPGESSSGGDQWTRDRDRSIGGQNRGDTVDFAITRQIQDAVNAELDRFAQTHDGADLDRAGQKQLAMHMITARISAWADKVTADGGRPPSAETERRLSAAVLAAMFGLGRIEQLLDDDDIEEVFINGAAPAVCRYGDGRTEIVGAVAESDEDLLGQLRSIATYHGQNERAVTSAWPFLNLRLPDGSRLAAQWSVTPHPQVTIRRHRFTDITLAQLVDMGTVSESLAAFLTAAVLGRRSILVAGSPTVGKTTLLRALARCLPRWERFATLETEYELLLHELPGAFPLLLPAEARPGTGETTAAGRPAGEVTIADIFPELLRHGLDRILVGEVRGAEIIPMLAAMSRGCKGSMSTFHADSAHGTFEALAGLLGEHKSNWSHAAAMAQIATAIDIIVYLDYAVTDTGRKSRFVSEVIEVGPVGENGQPAATTIYAPNPDTPDDPRGYPQHLPEDQTWCRKTGFDIGWLSPGNGRWKHPFPTTAMAPAFAAGRETP